MQHPGSAEFILDIESYRSEYQQHFADLFEPRTLYQFPIYLPFRIAIEGSNAICVPFDNHAFLYLFRDVKIADVRSGRVGALNEDYQNAPITQTRVEMVFVAATLHQMEEQFHNAFRTLLDGLNTLLTAYFLVRHDYRVHRVTREMLQFACIARLIHLPEWRVEKSLFLLHSDIAFDAAPLAQNKTKDLVRLAAVVANKINPFVAVAELRAAASRHFMRGSYRDAVITAQSAVEALLGTLYVEALKLEGKTHNEAVTKRERTPFIQIVRKEMRDRLGGNWSTTDESTPVGEWYKVAYNLRNAVIHQGYFPDRAEAEMTLTAIRHLMNYIEKLLSEVSGIYEPLERFFGTASLTSLLRPDKIEPQ